MVGGMEKRVTEVVAALIWDGDRFLIASVQPIKRGDCFGSLSAARWNLKRQRNKLSFGSARKNWLSPSQWVKCLWKSATITRT